MKEQERVLKQYLELSGKMTLKQIASESGIQITRVFRLMNGCEMRLKEYLIIESLIQKKLGGHAQIKVDLTKSLNNLSPEGLSYLQEIIERKFLLWELCN